MSKQARYPVFLTNDEARALVNVLELNVDQYTTDAGLNGYKRLKIRALEGELAEAENDG